MRKSHGFSLVEVIVSSLIMMLSLTGFVSLHIQLLNAERKLLKRHVALEIARDSLEQIALAHKINSNLSEDFNLTSSLMPDSKVEKQQDTVEYQVGDNPNAIVFQRQWSVADFEFEEDESELLGKQKQHRIKAKNLKKVSVTISWKNNHTSEHVTLNRLLSPVPLYREALLESRISAIKSP